jgi:hypothetical protein
MRSFIIIISLLSCPAIIWAQAAGVYGHSVTDAGEIQHSLQAYQGKRIWLVIAPVSPGSEGLAFLRRVDSIAAADSAWMQTILVPSYEAGYVQDSAHTLMDWYRRALNRNVLLSAPLHTRRSSGTSQDALFRWLTHAEQNGHFDTDDTGAGSMFVIDKTGRQKAVLGPVTMWNNRLLTLAFQ